MPKIVAPYPVEHEWAALSPEYKPGERIYAYINNVPGVIICRDERYLGYWIVKLDTSRKMTSVAWDNISNELIPPNRT